MMFIVLKTSRDLFIPVDSILWEVGLRLIKNGAFISFLPKVIFDFQ